MFRRGLYLILPVALLLAACGGAQTAEPVTLVAVTPMATNTAAAEASSPPAADTAAAEPPTMLPPTATAAGATAAGLAGELDTYLRSQTEAGRFSGAALVLRDGAAVLSRGYGLADRAAGTPNAPDTRFPLGTLTMPFTALAALQLHDRGALDIDDPICDYLPDCPAGWAGVAVRHLLDHSSGIPAAHAEQYYEISRGSTEPSAEAMQRVSDSVTDFTPGSLCPELRSSDYLLLGLIVEAAAGQPYAAYLEENVLAPLGMANTGRTDGLAAGYLAGRGDRMLPPEDLAAKFSAAGLTSTLDDMARWAEALLDGRLLAPQTAALLFTGDGDNVGCAAGYGWRRQEETGVFAPGGEVAGFPASMGIRPEEGLVWVVLANQQTADAPELGEMLARIAAAGSLDAALAQLPERQEGPPPADELAARITEFLGQQAAAGRFSGSVLVARGDEVVLSQGFGLADREQGIANTSQTPFRIASMTKAVTAMAIMQLSEQGLLSVDDPICDYLSDCPEAWRPITIHHLLTHTSGLQGFIDVPSLLQLESPTAADQIRLLAQSPLMFDPGAGFAYSNAGYSLLGLIVEQVSGRPYADFVRQNILAPLGMTSSGFGLDPDGAAVGYSNAFQTADNDWMWAIDPAGGMYSTVEDMQRWARALTEAQLVSGETMAQIFTPYVTANFGDGGQYGYGWEISRTHGRPSIRHGGAVPGFDSHIALFPEDDLTVILLSNMEAVGTWTLSDILAKWALGVD